RSVRAFSVLHLPTSWGPRRRRRGEVLGAIFAILSRQCNPRQRNASNPAITMFRDASTYSLPRWRLTRWLADAGPDVPADIRLALLRGLFGSLPVFFGGVINTLLVSGVIAARLPRPLFITWFALEVVICVTRLSVLLVARRAAASGRNTPTDIYVVLGVCWAF